MSISTAIRDWLLLVGDQYGIREAHEDRRPAGQAKMPRPHFVYRFEDSQADAGTAVQALSDSGNNAADIELTKTFLRTLTVECHVPMQSEQASPIDGMRVLESAQVSLEHPAVRAILNQGSGNDIVLNPGLPIVNNTETSEKYITRIYTLSMAARVCTRFALVRTDHLVDDYTITGELTDDNDDTVTVTVSGSVT